MSGVLKSVGRVFKKVAKVVKKVAPYALAVGAVVLTGGAALGALPAVGTMVASLGLPTALTGALTGAISGAGISGAIGLATGGLKGLKKGALIGGLTGGALGAMGSGFNVGQGTLSAAPAGGVGSGSAAASGAVTPSTFSNGLGASMPGIPTAPDLMLPNVSAVPTVAARSGGVLSAIGDLVTNPAVASTIVNGVGQGVVGRLEAGDRRKAAQRITDSYDGVAYPSFADGLAMNPSARGPGGMARATGAPPRWYYDNAAKRILQAGV
jgi:hypothetical protein